LSYYWHLKNPDPGMSLFAERRVVPYVKRFEDMIEEACKGAYQSRVEQHTLDMSDQRLDFKINAWQRAKILASAKVNELMKEANSRRSSESGQPDR
jgi:hypothetical protein